MLVKHAVALLFFSIMAVVILLMALPDEAAVRLHESEKLVTDAVQHNSDPNAPRVRKARTKRLLHDAIDHNSDPNAPLVRKMRTKRIVHDAIDHASDPNNPRVKRALQKFLNMVGHSTEEEDAGNSGLIPLPKTELAAGELQLLKRLREEVLTLRRPAGDYDHPKFATRIWNQFHTGAYSTPSLTQHSLSNNSNT
jgi:hypothetical protein